MSKGGRNTDVLGHASPLMAVQQVEEVRTKFHSGTLPDWKYLQDRDILVQEAAKSRIGQYGCIPKRKWRRSRKSIDIHHSITRRIVRVVIAAAHAGANRNT